MTDEPTSLTACGSCHRGFRLIYLQYEKDGFLVCRECYYEKEKEK